MKRHLCFPLVLANALVTVLAAQVAAQTPDLSDPSRHERFIIIVDNADPSYYQAASDYLWARYAHPGFPATGEGLLVTCADIHNDPTFTQPEGIRSPQEIRAFLMWAHENWLQPPEYVILMGLPSYVSGVYPPGTIGAHALGATAGGGYSDTWMVDFDDGDERCLPAIALGRLPARNPGDILRYAYKVGEHCQQWSYPSIHAQGGVYVLNHDTTTLLPYNSGPLSHAYALELYSQIELPAYLVHSSDCVPPHSNSCMEALAIDAAPAAPVMIGVSTRSKPERFVGMQEYPWGGPGINPGILNNAYRTPYAISILCEQACYDYADPDLANEAFVVNNCLFKDYHEGVIAFTALTTTTDQGTAHRASMAFADVVDALYLNPGDELLGDLHVAGFLAAVEASARFATDVGWGTNFYGDPSLPLHRNHAPEVTDIAVDGLVVSELDPIVQCEATASDLNGDEDYTTLEYAWSISPSNAGGIGPVAGQPWKANLVLVIPPPKKVYVYVTATDGSTLTGGRSEAFSFTVMEDGLDMEGGTSEDDSLVVDELVLKSVETISTEQYPTRVVFTTATSPRGPDSTLRIVDVQGRLVANLRPGGRALQGRQSWLWEKPPELPSGVYLYVWDNGAGTRRTGKLLHIR